MKRLVLLRHGESLYNAEARVQGQRCAGLSDLGHAQAKVTAAALAESYPQARLVTSDLQRAVETTAPLEAALGRPADHDPRIRERRFGSWEGQLRDEVIAAEPERWRRWVGGEDVIAEVGGESTAVLADRVEPVFRALLETTSERGVTIAVTHGGPVWHGVHRILDLPRPVLGAVDNCSIAELGLTAGGDVVLVRWNEIAHLPSELRVVWQPARSADGPPVGR